MKKLIFFIFIFNIFFDIYSQVNTECYVPYPDLDIDIKYVPLRFHYILYSETEPGNFTEFTDGGVGGSFSNGYEFAEDLINRANIKLENSQNIIQYPNDGNPPPSYDPMYRFVLANEGTRYYIDPDCYDGNDCSHTQLMNKYLDESDCKSAINIFAQAGGGGGEASFSYECFYLRVTCLWEEYRDKVNNDPNIYGLLPFLIVHESGHVFGLEHLYDTICTSDVDDCDDTPSIDTLISLGFSPDSICNWGNPDEPNNVMDFGSKKPNFTLTPCQLGKIHYHLLNKSYSTLLDLSDFPPIVNINNDYTFSMENIPVFGEEVILGDGTTQIEIPAGNPGVVIATDKIKILKNFKANKNCHFHAFRARAADLLKSTSNQKNEEKKDKNNGFKKDLNVDIYPNPTNGIFTIKSNTSGFNYKIYNSVGDVIFEKLNVTEDECDFSGRPKGIYFVRITNENSTVIKKIVIR